LAVMDKIRLGVNPPLVAGTRSVISRVNHPLVAGTKRVNSGVNPPLVAGTRRVNSGVNPPLVAGTRRPILRPFRCGLGGGSFKRTPGSLKRTPSFLAVQLICKSDPVYRIQRRALLFLLLRIYVFVLRRRTRVHGARQCGDWAPGSGWAPVIRRRALAAP